MMQTTKWMGLYGVDMSAKDAHPPAETCIECGHQTDANFGSYEPEGFICDDCYWGDER